MDRRTVKTRKAILNAFHILLSQKSYSKITIQNIIDEADIGRSTFYAHFETKDDLLKELCTDLFSHIFSDTLNNEETHDFSFKPVDLTNRLVHILYHLKENRKNIKGILDSDSNGVFYRCFKEYFITLIGKGRDPAQHSDRGSVPYEFLVNHITGSFFAMIKWWFLNDLRYTPEELAGYFMTVMQPVLPADG